MTKLYIVLTVAALTASVAMAAAQNQPTPNVSPPPNSINAGSRTIPSGAEGQPPAPAQALNIIGQEKFCEQISAPGTLNCTYETMSACQKATANNNLHCVANPAAATTGAQ